MNRTQHWCDNCGKLVEDKSVPKNDSTFYLSTTWEIWAPDEEGDTVYCSIDCLITGAQNLRIKIEEKERNEDN